MPCGRHARLKLWLDLPLNKTWRANPRGMRFRAVRCCGLTGTLKFDMLESMEPQGQQSKREIDVTGLPEEAIRALQSVISALRGQTGTGSSSFLSREEWARAIKQWAESHP